MDIFVLSATLQDTYFRCAMKWRKNDCQSAAKHFYARSSIARTVPLGALEGIWYLTFSSQHPSITDSYATRTKGKTHTRHTNVDHDPSELEEGEQHARGMVVTDKGDSYNRIEQYWRRRFRRFQLMQ